MQEGTYVGEDADGDPVSLSLEALGDTYSGVLTVGGRELPVMLSPVDGDLVGAVHMPGEGYSFLLRASLFCGVLQVDYMGSLLQLRPEEP